MNSASIRSFDAVTPEFYLDLARELANSMDGVSLRSAVDRAYYSTFLAARDEIAAKRYTSFTTGSGAHSQVVEALSNIGRRDLGRQLRILRRARNQLTYQTSPMELPKGQSLGTLLDSAHIVIEAVQSLPQNHH